MDNLKRLQGDTGREHTSTENSYRGIPMFCDKDLHEKCFHLLSSLAKDSRILVLGSGGGAFDQRLVDAGFTHVTSVDFRPDFFRAVGTIFIERDLNESFSDLGRFDLIIAIELIEHLENPAHFLRNTAQCLTETGKLIVTTPNIESGPSRASFLSLGHLAFFTETDLHGSGHISPLPHHLFSFHANNANLAIVKHTYNRNAWIARLVSNGREFFENIQKCSLKHLVRACAIVFKSIALFILWPFTRIRKNDGNVHIYELKKI